MTYSDSHGARPIEFGAKCRMSGARFQITGHQKPSRGSDDAYPLLTLQNLDVQEIS